MQIQNLIWGIVGMISIGSFIYLIVKPGNLAWRHPDKLKEKAIERSTRFYSSDAFVWMVRITTISYGLTLLVLILLSLLGFVSFLQVDFTGH